MWWLIQCTHPDGTLEPGEWVYSTKAVAELAAAWRSKKRHENWVVVERNDKNG